MEVLLGNLSYHTIKYYHTPSNTITYHYIPLHTATYRYIPLQWKFIDTWISIATFDDRRIPQGMDEASRLSTQPPRIREGREIYVQGSNKPARTNRVSHHSEDWEVWNSQDMVLWFGLEIVRNQWSIHYWLVVSTPLKIFMDHSFQYMEK